MQYKIKVNNLRVADLAVITAVDSIHRQQSHDCIVSKIDKLGYHFQLKANLNGAQMQRLFADRVPLFIEGYQGELYEEDHKNYLRVYNVNK